MELDFLLADTDASFVIADVEDDLGSRLVEQLRLSRTYDRVVGYLAEAKLAGAPVTLIDAICFTGFGGCLPVAGISDPLQLGPGDSERLATLVRESRTAVEEAAA